MYEHSTKYPLTLIHKKNSMVMLSWMKFKIIKLYSIGCVLLPKAVYIYFSLIIPEHMFGILKSNGMVPLFKNLSILQQRTHTDQFLVFQLEPVVIPEHSNNGGSRSNAI